jgi:hypothetical protein
LENLAVIVIPLYKASLSPHEELAVKQCFKLLSQYKIVAVKPYDLDLANYSMNFDEVIDLDNNLFKNIAGYNKLMLLSSFYELFLDYKFMLVYQPDTFVFKNDLTYWCNQGYDYIGAPWLKFGGYPDFVKKYKTYILRYIHTKLNIKQPGTDLPTDIQSENRVGNGGLSLRNVSKFYEVCIKKQKTIDFYNSRPEYYFGEDVFWSIEANRDRTYLNIPDYRVAVNFSIENNVDYAMGLVKADLPFGCHAWDRDIDIWRPYFEKVGVII